MFDSDSAIMLEALRRMLGSVGAGTMASGDLDRAFRAAHSIKSEAGFLRIDEVATASHHLEDVLAAVRRADGMVEEQVAAELRRGVKALADALTRYRAAVQTQAPSGSEDAGAAGPALESGPEQQPAPAETPANEAAAPSAARPGASTAVSPGGRSGSRAERSMLREARSRGERVFRIVVRIGCDPELSYARAFLVVNNLELCCVVVRTEPDLDTAASSPIDRLQFLVTSPSDEEIAREAVFRAVHVDEVELVEFSELSFDESLEEDTGPRAAGAPARSGEPERVLVPAQSQEEVALYADEILAAAEAAAREVGPDETVSARLAAIGRYARALREQSGTSGRVQLLDLFRELRSNAVRYSAAQGKRVRVLVGGGGAAVPPAVGDTILEAVLHLVRNSIDHGIEPIEERARKGRHPAATIKVRVDRIGASVRIVVQDDGVGLDEQKVRARSGDATSPLLSILATPGFSMRERADAGSGRGVGLDNVVHSVRSLLGGQIKLTNRPGSGMTVVISFSGTTRLLHVVLVESAESACAIPSATIVTHERLERRRVKRDSFGSLYYDYDGKTLALSTVTGRSPSPRSIHDGALAVIVRAGSELRAILSDAILGEETVVRDEGRTRRVYSRLLAKDVNLVFPPALVAAQETDLVGA